eukprot:gene5938-6537_t
MSLVTIALIGKSNDPLYFYCKENASEYLHQQMIAFSALDVVEERKKRAMQSSSFEMFLGQLFPVDEYKVFGSYSNSQLKLILICYNPPNEVLGIRETINSLWSAFVSAVQNPFQECGRPIKSRRLDIAVQQIVDKHNALNLKRR